MMNDSIENAMLTTRPVFASYVTEFIGSVYFLVVAL